MDSGETAAEQTQAVQTAVVSEHEISSEHPPIVATYLLRSMQFLLAQGLLV